MHSRKQFNRATNLYAVQGGDQHIHHHHSAPDVGLHAFMDADEIDVRTLKGQPSQLLLARNQTVDFTGREAELEKLHRWLLSMDRASVLLIHGAGGIGKTRLAAQFAKSCGDDWTVLIAQHGGCAPGSDEPMNGTQRLIIADYAERWPREDLLALVAKAGMGDSRIRILLLARTPNPWWGELLNRLRKLLVSIDQMALGHLAEDPDVRQQVFAAACASFARIYETTAARLRPAGSLQDSRYRSVLTIHMSALAAVDADYRGHQPPGDPGALSRYLLDRERDHWATMHENRRIRTDTQDIGRAAFVATVVGPTSRDAGLRILEAMGLADGKHAAGQILDDHAACYPPADGSTVLEPFAPDRLGEDFVARCLQVDAPAEGGDSWAHHASQRILAEEQFTEHLPGTITVLAETAKRWNHVHDHLNDRVRRIPERMVAMAGTALTALAKVADVPVLMAIEPHLPEQDIDLDSSAVIITERLTNHRLQRTNCQATHADLRVKLSRRLANVGVYDRARAESQEATRLFRCLVDAGESRYEANLAAALHDLGTHLAAVDERDAALAATQEAVRYRSVLAATAPAVHRHDLAASLDNLATDLWELGLYASALTTAQQAADLHRVLAAESRDHDPSLALSLYNLGIHLAQIDRWDDAIAVTDEAMDLFKASPSGQDDELADALINVGAYWHELGAPARTASWTKAAVQIREQQAQRHPVEFQPAFARTLRDLADCTSDLGLHGLARDAGASAVDLLERLYKSKPDTYDIDLAAALHSHAIHLARSADSGQALAIANRAVSIRARLTRQALEAYESQLDGVLEELGVVRLRPQVRANSTQAPVNPRVRRLQDSVDAIMAVNDPGNADSLEHLRIRLFRSSRLTTAVSAVIPDALVSLQPAGRTLVLRRTELARSLGNLSNRLAETNKRGEALTAAEQAVESFWQLTSADQRHRREFVSALANLGLCLADVGRRDDALKATRAALAGLQATGKSSRVSLQEAAILQVFGWVRMTIGRELKDPVARRTFGKEFREALDAASRATAIHRKLSTMEPRSFARGLRSSIELESDLLSALGRTVEAEQVAAQLDQLSKEYLALPELTIPSTQSATSGQGSFS